MHEPRLAKGIFFIKIGFQALKGVSGIRLLSDNTQGNMFQYLD